MEPDLEQWKQKIFCPSHHCYCFNVKNNPLFLCFFFFLEKMDQPRPLFVFFGLFKQTIDFLQQINVKNVHPVYGAGIRTHNLSIMSCHP